MSGNAISAPCGLRSIAPWPIARFSAIYTRRVFTHFFPDCDLRLLFDVSHNTCKVEQHLVKGKRRNLFVHRKGATRAFGPGHRGLPAALRTVGQPVLIGGSMGTGSYVLAGTAEPAKRGRFRRLVTARAGLSRATRPCGNGAGVRLSMTWRRREFLSVRRSTRGVAEEAPGAYKDVGAVVAAAEHAGLARRVARLRPLICIKG